MKAFEIKIVQKKEYVGIEQKSGFTREKVIWVGIWYAVRQQRLYTNKYKALKSFTKAQWERVRLCSILHHGTLTLVRRKNQWLKQIQHTEREREKKSI